MDDIIKQNMEALSFMLGQGIITYDEYSTITARMGIIVNIGRDGRIKILNKADK